MKTEIVLPFFTKREEGNRVSGNSSTEALSFSLTESVVDSGVAETERSCHDLSDLGAGRQTGVQEDLQTRASMAQEMLKAVVGLQPSL